MSYLQFKFRALFAYEDGPQDFATAEENENGIIVEFTASGMAEATHIAGQFLNTHRGVDSEIDFVCFDRIVTLVQD